MLDQLHHRRFRRAFPLHAGNECDTGAMKLQMRQTDSLQKFVPGQRHQLGLVRSIVSHGAAIGSQLLEKWNQHRIQIGRVMFASFATKADLQICEVHVPVHVEPGFRNAAALVQGDLKRHVKKMRPIVMAIWIGLCGQCFDLGADLGDLRLSHFGFFRRGRLLQAELGASVVGDVATRNRLIHDDTQNFQVEDRGVLADAIEAARGRTLPSPSDVALAILPGQVSRGKDFFFFEVKGEETPGEFNALVTARGRGVTKLNVVADPVPSIALVLLDDFGFIARTFVAELAGFLELDADADAESGAFTFCLSSLRIAPFDPPVGACFALIEAGHKRMCPSVPRVHQEGKIKAQNSEAFQSFDPYPYYRGFESLSLRQFICKELGGECALNVPLVVVGDGGGGWCSSRFSSSISLSLSSSGPACGGSHFLANHPYNTRIDGDCNAWPDFFKSARRLEGYFRSSSFFEGFQKCEGRHFIFSVLQPDDNRGFPEIFLQPFTQTGIGAVPMEDRV
jgi:hypothetical protein